DGALSAMTKRYFIFWVISLLRRLKELSEDAPLALVRITCAANKQFFFLPKHFFCFSHPSFWKYIFFFVF
uniref:Uncharacterized protein n=1 Tax=Cyclopterus lumpus TaxID=8103 RepID=A0A8C2XEQ7_CYCLU